MMNVFDFLVKVEPLVGCRGMIPDEFWESAAVSDLRFELLNEGFCIVRRADGQVVLAVYEFMQTLFSSTSCPGQSARYSGQMSDQKKARELFDKVVDQLLVA